MKDSASEGAEEEGARRSEVLKARRGGRTAKEGREGERGGEHNDGEEWEMDRCLSLQVFPSTSLSCPAARLLTSSVR